MQRKQIFTELKALHQMPVYLEHFKPREFFI